MVHVHSGMAQAVGRLATGALVLCWLWLWLWLCLLQVALHEGLMVSVSRAGSLELQTQLLEVWAT